MRRAQWAPTAEDRSARRPPCRGRRGRRFLVDQAEVSSEHSWRGVRPLVAVCGMSARRVGYFGHPGSPREPAVDRTARRAGTAARRMRLDRRGRHRGKLVRRAEGLADGPLRGHRGSQRRRGRRAVLLRADTRPVARRGRRRTATSWSARTSCARWRRPAGRGRRSRTRSTSCSARPGTPRSSRTGGRVTARR